MVTIAPSASWNGRAGSGGDAPTASGTPHGSGFTKRAIAWFDEPEGMWITTTDHHISVGAGIGNRAWIDEVVFYLEGTEVTVASATINPRTGTIGYEITPVSRTAGTPLDGEASLYAKIIPVNGLERVIGPLPLSLNTNGSISRPEIFVATTGNDSTGNGTVGNPYATPTRALNAAGTSPAIIKLAPGLYTSFNGGGNFANVRQVVIEASGPGVVINPTDAPLRNFRWSNRRIRFKDIEIITDNFAQIYGVNTSDGYFTFDNCHIHYSAGAAGIQSRGYPNGWLNSETFQKQNVFYLDVNRFSLIDCVVEDFNVTGISLMRNCDITTSQDCWVQFRQQNIAIFNVRSHQYGNQENRLHTGVDATVASVAYNAGTNRTTITLSGSPTLAGQAGTNDYLRVLQSANGVAVGDQLFPENPDGSRDFEWLGWIIPPAGLNNTNKTVQVVGNLSALQAGDIVRAYTIGHGDAFQIFPAPALGYNRSNVVVQNYKVSAHSWQPFLFQAGGVSSSIISNSSTTVTTSGTAATFSGNHGLNVGDWIVINNNSQTANQRRVVAVGSSTTCTLATAFSPNLTSSAWAQIRNVGDYLFVNSIFHKASQYAEFGQIGQGVENIVYVGCSVPGLNSFGTSAGFAGMQSGKCFDTVVAFDCIWKNLNASASGFTPSFPSDIYVGDNNHYETGNQRDTVGSGGTGIVTLDSVGIDGGYYPVAGLTKTIETVLVPWDLNGNIRAIGDPIGPVAKPEGAPPIDHVTATSITPTLAKERDLIVTLRDANGAPIAAPADISGTYTIELVEAF